MADQGVDVLLLSVGRDLPYLTGYEAMPLERLTMLVVPRDGDATMVIPRLEAPRVVEQPGVFALRPWEETEDPSAIVAELAGGAATAAVGDQMWARFLVELLPRLGGTEFRRAVDVVGPLRMVKDAAEIAALRAAGAAADRVADQLHAGEIPLVGRTEAQVSADISARLLAEGHDKVNFAIVAAGENAASPHHHAGDRVIRAGEIVLCDFGGTMAGYCSDTTRCVFTGRAVGRDRRRLRRAARGPAGQRGGGHRRHAVPGRRPGRPADHRRRRLRRVLRPPHRPRHRHGGARGPLHRRGQRPPLVAGHAFSVEPGIYLPGRWGMRLEDIVVATAAGPEALNASDHALVVGLTAWSARAAGELRLVGVGGVRRQLDRHVGGVEAGQHAVVERAVDRRAVRHRDRHARRHLAGDRSGSSRSSRRRAPRRRGAGGPPRSSRRSPAPAGCC